MNEDIGAHIRLALDLTNNLDGKIGKYDLKDYQLFTSKVFLGLKTLKKLLLFWDTGAGKTLASVYMVNHLHILYPKWHIIILIPAALHHDPWQTTLDEFKTSEFSITMIHYDDPNTPSHILVQNKIKEINLKVSKVLFIIDECHNFVSRSITKNFKTRHTTKTYNYINNFINKNEGNKLLLISATPVLNNLREFNTLVGLLRKNKIEITEDQFYNGKIISRNTLLDFLSCSCSYYRYNETESLVNTPPSLNFPSKNINFIEVNMTNYQANIYKDAYFAELKNKTGGYRIHRRLAGTFVYKGLKSDAPDQDALLAQFITEFTIFNFSKEFLEAFTNSDESFTKYLVENITHEKKIEEEYYNTLLNYSIKYIETCKICLRSPGKILIYEPFVNFEGIVTLEIYFRLFGITKVVYSNNSKNRHLNLIEFNRPENINGDEIKCCIFSKAGVEGISFTGINELIILDIPWSDAQLRQTIGRGIRFNSHILLPDNRKYINVNIIIAKCLINGIENSVDKEMLGIIKRKNDIIIDLYNVFKESSIESFSSQNQDIQIDKEYVFEQIDNMEIKFLTQTDVLEIRNLNNINYTLDDYVTVRRGFLDKKTNQVWDENGKYVGRISNNIDHFKIINNEILVYEIIIEFNDFPVVTSILN